MIRTVSIQNKLTSLPSSLVRLDCLRTLDLSHNFLHSAEETIFQIQSLEYLGKQNLETDVILRQQKNHNQKCYFILNSVLIVLTGNRLEML